MIFVSMRSMLVKIIMINFHKIASGGAAMPVPSLG
jgi:hypothetical protein